MITHDGKDRRLWIICPKLGDRLAVGRLALDQQGQVRILVPQPYPPITPCPLPSQLNNAQNKIKCYCISPCLYDIVVREQGGKGNWDWLTGTRTLTPAEIGPPPLQRLARSLIEKPPGASWPSGFVTAVRHSNNGARHPCCLPTSRASASTGNGKSSTNSISDNRLVPATNFEFAPPIVCLARWAPPSPSSPNERGTRC